MRAAAVAVLVVAAVVAAVGVVASPNAAAVAPKGFSITFLPSRASVLGKATVMPIRVANDWPAKAVGITLTVTAPSWVKLAGPRCARRRGGIMCTLRDLAAGARVTVVIRATPSRLGAYRVVAQASASTVEEPGAP